jgi:hypothetical protein
MKTEKFTGTAVDQLELGYSYLLAHQGHFLLFTLINFDTAEIRCSSCKHIIVSGSREFLELVWLEWSMNKTEN